MLRAADRRHRPKSSPRWTSTIALKSDRRDAEALALLRTNRGKALMDEANVFLSGIIQPADERLTDRRRASSAPTPPCCAGSRSSAAS